jgi:hypothetical protein
MHHRQPFDRERRASKRRRGRADADRAPEPPDHGDELGVLVRDEPRRERRIRRSAGTAVEHHPGIGCLDEEPGRREPGRRHRADAEQAEGDRHPVSP